MKKLLIFVLVCGAFFSCIDVEEKNNDKVGNFEALWNMIDQRYCFFEFKAKEYGLDWNEVYSRYRPAIDTVKNEIELFSLFDNMLGELRDGHVNITSYFNTGRYWDWKEKYPTNFSDTLQRKYLGTNYYMAGSLKYVVFLPDTIGYVSCSSFSSMFSDNNLTYMLALLRGAKGLILDLRSNGGGYLTLAEKLAARFTEERILTGYTRHKTGAGHNDFSDYEPTYLTPFDGIRWEAPVVVLVNRGIFSAANDFVNMMKCCPNVTIVGDKTGGGSGMPFTSELPNGWAVRFSACPSYDRNKKDIEFGIEPDYCVSLTDSAFAKGHDDMIDFAIKFLASKE